MSFIGNIAAAQTAKAIGSYNAQMYWQQAEYARAKAERKLTAYEQLDKPRIIKQQSRDYSNFFVNILSSGAEFSGTPFLSALTYRVNQNLDLTIANYNATVDYQDEINNASLLEAKGIGEKFQGRMTARAEYFKAAGSLLAGANQPGAN